MSPSCAWHDFFICVTWLIHVRDVTHWCAWHGSFMCVTWILHVRNKIHSYAWHVWFMCVTWLIHMCDTTHSHAWYDSFICVTWLIHMCDTTHSYVRHDSFVRVDYSFMCVTWFCLFLWHCYCTSRMFNNNKQLQLRCLHNENALFHISRTCFRSLSRRASLVANRKLNSGIFS